MKSLMPFVIVLAFLFSSCTTTPNSSELTSLAIPTSSVTPVPSPSLTSTPESTDTATATEAPAYKTCPPENGDPRGCKLDNVDDLTDPNKFSKFLEGLSQPFSPQTEKIGTNPIATAYENDDYKIITFVPPSTYFSEGSDKNLSARLMGTSAYLEANINGADYKWFIYPLEIQDPKDPLNKDANSHIIGIFRITVDINHAASIVSDYVYGRPVPGIVVGYKYPGSGEIDPLVKLEYDKDPKGMDQAFANFINGDVKALNNKIVIIDLSKPNKPK